jgi:colicin import membrane protein
MSILDGTGLTPQPAGISVDSQERGSLTDKPMWKELRKNPRALLYAVLMHLLLFLALILNLDWKTTTPSGAGQSSVIKAQVVDNAKVQAEVNKLKQAQENKVQQEETRKNELERAAQQAEQRRVQEEQRLSEVKQKQVEEQKNLQKLEQQRIVQQKLEVERQSKLKIQQAEAEKQAKLKQEKDAKAAQQRAAAEEQKKTAAAAAKRKQDEAKQKAAEDKKRQAAAAAKHQQEAERALQQSLAAEENSARNQGIVDQYIDGIRSAVQNNWLQPPSARPGMQCTVRVNLIPGGDVAGVRITVSSGDAAFDRSVENAVRKAAPLPLPSDPGLFDNFRELTFVFKPEN